MDFTIPAHITKLLEDLHAFIEREIVPLQKQDDNDRFFDHRREWARTDFEGGGLPRKEWEDAAARNAPPRRQGGVPAPGAAGGIWRQEHRQSRDGDHPRASRGQGAWPAQRSAERNLGRRQFPADPDDARLRHRRAEEDHAPRHAERHRASRLRPHRAASTAPTRPGWKRARSRTAMAGASMARRCGTPASTLATHDMVFCRTVRQGRRCARAHLPDRADECAEA